VVLRLVHARAAGAAVSAFDEDFLLVKCLYFAKFDLNLEKMPGFFFDRKG